MITPERIWLIDMGDEITWCDVPDPIGSMPPDDSEGYIKLSEYQRLRDALEENCSCKYLSSGEYCWCCKALKEGGVE